MERRRPRGVVPVWRAPPARLSWQLGHGRPLRATLAPGAGPDTAAAAVAAVPPGRGRAPPPAADGPPGGLAGRTACRAAGRGGSAAPRPVAHAASRSG